MNGGFCLNCIVLIYIMLIYIINSMQHVSNRHSKKTIVNSIVNNIMNKTSGWDNETNDDGGP